LTNDILEHIGDGLPLKDAAALAGISYETFCEWRRKFPEFSEAIDRALARGVATRLKAIREAMDAGDLSAAKWWLEHVRPEHFAKSRLEVAHRHEGTVNHRLGIDESMLNAIAEARKRYEGSTDSA
jgi:hypothetical protein